MTAYTPTSLDRFSFGLWTVGWQGVDVFGPASRAPMDPVEATHRLAEIGASAVSFHDDDLVPDDARRQETLDRFGKALADTGLRVEMVTTNPVQRPGVQGRRADSERPSRASLRPREGPPQHRPGGIARRRDLRPVGRTGGCGARRGQGCGCRTRPHEGVARPAVRLRPGPGLHDAVHPRPKPNEPRGDILLPTIGHALALIAELEHPEMVGLNPEVGHEEMAGLNFAHGIAQAMWHGKLFHIDLNGQHGPRFDQDLRFGAGNLRGAFWTVDTLVGAGTGKGYDGYVHFDYKPPRAEAEDGVWESARACMRNYLILRERVTAFRADPDVKTALAAARVDELARPTLGPEESLADLRAEHHLLEELTTRSVAMEALDQLALEHLLGVR